MSKSRISGIVNASMEDVRAAEAADLAAAEAAAAEAAAAEAAAAGAPVEGAPVEGAPVEGAPVEGAPVEGAPVEGAEVVAPPVLAIEDIVADPDTLEADLVDVNEAEAEVQTNTDAVAELSDVQEGLEAIALSLEAAAAEGGLTPQSAGFMQIAFESYTNRLGEPANVPSMESFGGQTSRVSSTELSMESVKDVLAKVWEAIKTIILKVRDAIISFFKQLMSGAERLRVRAEKIKGIVAKASGNAKKDEIELGSLAAKIAVGTKVEVSNKSISDVVTLADQTLSFDESASKALTADFESLRQAVNSGERVQSAGELQPPAAFSKKVTGGVSTDVLPGNTTFSIVVNTGVEKAPTAINKLLAGGWSVTKEVAPTKVANDIKIKTLDFAAIGHIADECLKIADASKKGAAKVAENGKSTASGLKAMKISKDVAGDKVAGVKADMKAFQKRAAAQDQATTKVLAYAVNVGRAYLAIAEKSLAQYGNTTAIAEAA